MNNRDVLIFRECPDLFCKNVLGDNITIEDVLERRALYATAPTSQQIEIMNSVRDNQRTAVQASHAVGKSHIAARIALWFSCCFYPSIVITTAPKAAQVKSVLWARIAQAFNNASVLIGGDMYTTVYYPNRKADPNWFMQGMTAKDAESFSGWHEKNVLVIIDEASGVPEHTYAALEGLLSSERSKVLEISNPTTNYGDFANHCKNPEKEGYNVIKMNCYSHPNVIYGREIYAGAVAPTWPNSRKEAWGEDSPMFKVRVMGEFPTNEENAILPLRYIEAAVAREVDNCEGKTAWGLDVARRGAAESVLMRRSGQMFFMDWSESISTTTGLVRRVADDDVHTIGVDTVGVGGGVIDGLDEIEGIQVLPFAANNISDAEEERRKKEQRESQARGRSSRNAVRAVRFRSEQDRKASRRFRNLASESWWRLREQLEETYKATQMEEDDPAVGISLPDDEDLIHQLSMRTYKTDNEVVEITPKEKAGMKQDKADALIICDRTWRKTEEHKPNTNAVTWVTADYEKFAAR